MYIIPAFNIVLDFQLTWNFVHAHTKFALVGFCFRRAKKKRENKFNIYIICCGVAFVVWLLLICLGLFCSFEADRYTQMVVIITAHLLFTMLMSTKVNTLIYSKFEQHRAISRLRRTFRGNCGKNIVHMIWARGDSKEQKNSYMQILFLVRIQFTSVCTFIVRTIYAVLRWTGAFVICVKYKIAQFHNTKRTREMNGSADGSHAHASFHSFLLYPRWFLALGKLFSCLFARFPYCLSLCACVCLWIKDRIKKVIHLHCVRACVWLCAQLLTTQMCRTRFDTKFM